MVLLKTPQNSLPPQRVDEFVQLLNDGVRRWLTPCHWVMLVRQSLLDQAVSFYAAQLTGVYGTGPTGTPWSPATREGLAAAIHRIADEESLFRRFFAINAIEPLFVTYESLIEEPGAVVSWIAETLGIPFHEDALQAALALERRYEKPDGLIEQIRALPPVA